MARGATCNLFYELVENQPQTTRRLNGPEGEKPRRMFARCILASVVPLQFRDGREGFQRRVLTLETLPRHGDPDPSLKAALEGDTPRHHAIRAEAASWALSMPLAEVLEVLARNDPEGLLRAAAAAVAATSDTVSQWADACLMPSPLGPDTEVRQQDWLDLYESYMGWCRYSNVPTGMQRTNFISQLRRTLGPARCLERHRESTDEARAAGRTQAERLNLPRFDAGFTLRPGLWLPHALEFKRDVFNPRGMSDGGLEAIAALPAARRPEVQP
ncbi:hypothetical protein H8F24_17790 [Synechococcus sp. CBW1002]|uniref:hypothetical protein n=1 Tax=Synechococcus sp. CBW1002 TaxID=1353134 RepID=UPI0018CD6B8E|nr:hypothetical protein [Synechococcus sp. CBW1002]QPN59769.1 hypothetical protein H8F24_17790 [Synechococcus sp. CBW1002]